MDGQLRDILASLRSAGLADVLPEGVGLDDVDAIVGEAARFAFGELLPLNRVGDREGVRIENGVVRTATGWKAAYDGWAAGGWPGLSAPEAWGGQGLPVMVQMAVEELWNAANCAFATGLMLSIGAAKTIAAHGDEALKAAYLPKLVAGEWTGTMNLTEPQAGSDLGAIRTRADRAADGTYRITGQKIFITYGDHELTPNIVHLVLARLADAPAGSAGISLFLVPKFLLRADGAPGERNGVAVAGLEKKLGHHGAPTCAMVFDGATGFLVGAENRGLAAMFTMMNLARLSVGVQGVGVAARAAEVALGYALERRQGRAPGWAGEGMSPIALHPDVRAMLVRMEAMTAAARALCHACAHAIDMSHGAPEAERAAHADRAALLTPVAKAFSSDVANEVASLAVQVHGGAGYIEETGVAQLLRDARVFAIYEGTNGIQAADLVLRKLKLGEGGAVASLLTECSGVVARVRAANRPGFGATAERLGAALGALHATAMVLAAALGEDRRAEALSGATSFLRLFALAVGGCLLARSALADGGDAERRTALARYFAEVALEEASGLAAIAADGHSALEQAAAALIPAPAGG